MPESVQEPPLGHGSGQVPPLAGPPINPAFERELDELVALASQGQAPNSKFFNPPDEWLTSHMTIIQDMPQVKQEEILAEAREIDEEAQKANDEGKAAGRAGPGVAFRLDNGGLAFFSQLGVARRPDLTQYFIDGFAKNRDALAFSEANQAIFAEVFVYINRFMNRQFNGDSASDEQDDQPPIIQSDRQICDAPGRSFHARQLFFGTDYLQAPYMWRQLTFDMPDLERHKTPNILEVSIPRWLEHLDMPEDLKDRVREAKLTQLVFKAPTKGLSLHLGFDYVGEHKMGPLSIAMFQVKQANGLAVQAALSMARIKTLDNTMTNTALVTIGPSLHGKSTLTIMIELANSVLAKHLDLVTDPQEGVYPMNDDIVLLQPLQEVKETTRGGRHVRISHGIDGTENNLYAVPFGLTQKDDPITYDVLRGTEETPNPQETLENVPVNVDDSTPNYLRNPVRNMRMILSRPRLLNRKGAAHLMEAITNGQMEDSVHVPMENTDRVFWQAVMRQNTVIPPLRRLGLEQYIRVLMYGEAVQMGAAIGAIGRPYVEYFSDPFIIGLEDENANLMYNILHEMADGGIPQEYYAFNTGGVGADTNDDASGSQYRKIQRDLTLMLQEALLRNAVKFEYDSVLGSDIAVAIVNQNGDEVVDLRSEWLPREIYGEAEYKRRVEELNRRRHYGRDAQDKAGILRYTKVNNNILDLRIIPSPINERELAWLLSFYWNVDQAYNSLPELVQHLGEGNLPGPETISQLQEKYELGLEWGLESSQDSQSVLAKLGLVVGKES